MRAAIACLLALAACGGDDDPDGGVDGGRDAEMPPRSASAIFDPPASGAASWGELPFPHDLYLGEDGTVDIAALHLTTPQWEAARAALDGRRGFCSSCGVYFPIDGSLDAASVPADADVSATASADDAVILFDADPDSPERGRLIPLRVEWNALQNVLAVRPVRGVVLAPGRTYAAAVTDRLLAEDGTALSASEVFASARDGGGDARAERARTVMQPGLDTLSTLGVPLERVVSLAVFTTGDPLAYGRSLRELVDAAPAPVATFDAASDRVWSGAALDTLLGRPAEDRPGWDVPAMDGDEGPYGAAHDAVGVVITGSFAAPRVVQGDPDDHTPAGLRLGADGLPEAGPLQRVPFTLYVPAGADLTSLPVMVFHTGTNDTRQLAAYAANTANRAGLAVLAVEHFTQGDRSATAVDTRHFAREREVETPTLGPDGLMEHNGVQVALALFGVGGTDPETEGSPIYMLGVLAQQVADDLAALRLVREGDWSAIAAADPALTGLSFDPNRVVFFGANQGAAVGSVALAVAEGVGAAVLYTPFSSWPDQLIESRTLQSRFQLSLSGFLGFSGSYDEVERRLVFDIGVDLFKWVVEPTEPGGAMRAMYADPTATERPHLFMQLMEWDEWVCAPTSEALVAAAGVPGIGDFDFATIAAETAPVSANVTTGDGSRTVVAYEVPAATHLAILQQSGGTRTHQQPLIPPWSSPIEPPMAVPDPVTEVHAQIGHFLSTFVTTGTPEVCAIDACPTP